MRIIIAYLLTLFGNPHCDAVALLLALAKIASVVEGLNKKEDS